MAPPLLEELKRRRVIRALVGYGIAAFAVLQIIEPVMHGLHWPESVLSYVVVALGAGFPVVVSLAWIFDVKAGRLERTGPANGLKGTRLALFLVGIGLLAAAPGTIWYFVVRGIGKPAATMQEPARSIAVLPFADMSPGKDQEYFSDGIAEEILNALAQVEGLRVIGRTSSFSFKGKNEDLRTIGEKLNVATVLEGSVRKEGNRIRITAQLIEAAGGSHLWSETYDREMTGIFAAQDEISKAVVEALRVRLVSRKEPARKHAPRPEAHNEYLLGNQFLYRLTYDNFLRAKGAYERATQLDREYAQAWAGLALATFWVADGADSATALSEGFNRSLAYADKAVELDLDLADGYAARGFLRSSIRKDWEGARSDFERAISLNPSDSDTHRRYAQSVLAAVGRLPEAVEEARKATVIDPLSAVAWSTFGRMLYSAGQLDEALVALEKSLHIAPEQNFAAANLAVVLLLQKRPEEALAAAARPTSEVFQGLCKAMALHDLGRTGEAQRVLDELIARFGHSGAYQIAGTYAWLGQTDKAFEWLDRALAQRDGGLTALKYDVVLRSLHGDPRFAAMLRKMNLPPD